MLITTAPNNRIEFTGTLQWNCLQYWDVKFCERNFDEFKDFRYTGIFFLGLHHHNTHVSFQRIWDGTSQTLVTIFYKNTKHCCSLLLFIKCMQRKSWTTQWVRAVSGQWCIEKKFWKGIIFRSRTMLCSYNILKIWRRLHCCKINTLSLKTIP